MPQENVELVYQFIDAFNRRDLDSFLVLCDTDVEYFSHVVELEGGGPYRGHTGIRRWWAACSRSPRLQGGHRGGSRPW